MPGGAAEGGGVVGRTAGGVVGRTAGGGVPRAAGGLARAESAGGGLGFGFGLTVESDFARPGTDTGGLPGETGSAGGRGSAAESDGAAGSRVSEG